MAKQLTTNLFMFKTFYGNNILKCSKEAGAVLIDAVISIAVISLAFAVLLNIGTWSIKISTSLREATQANSQLKEVIEAVRNFRDGKDWATDGLGLLATGADNPYHLFLDTSSSPAEWNLVSGIETSGIFTNQIIFDRVSRDPSTYNIEAVYNSSRDDPNTRKVTAIISWRDRTLQLITYFTNWE